MKKAFVATVVLFVLAFVTLFAYQLDRYSKRIDFVNVHVLDSNKHPVSGVTVFVQRAKAKKGLEQPRLIGITNGLGIAQYLDLPPGQYDVRLPNIICMGETMGMTVELVSYMKNVKLELVLDNQCSRGVSITPR